MLKIDRRGISILCEVCRVSNTHGVTKNDVQSLVDSIKQVGWQVEIKASGEERHVCLDCAYKAAVAERNRAIRGGLATR
jgi:hypothetical protein